MKTIYKKLLFLLLLLPFSMLAQNAVTGTVLEKGTGQPIPGANVNVQGTTNGVSTDFDGKYKLSNVKKGDKIVFSFIGLRNVTVTYDGQATLNVSLDEDANELKEVVVQVGYGSVKKKDATGSVAILGAKDFNKGAIVSVDQLLSGKAAGVRITNNGGQPDSAPNIRIRGGASLSASNDPLIIIDGVPISNENPAGVSNPLSLVNPNDVESFSILKDASATAIYGVRASNGVIIITTKKGTSGAPQFNYSSNVSVGQVGKKINVMNSSDFVRFIQEYHPTRTNDLGIDDPSNTLVDDPTTPEIEGRIIADTNWQDQVYRTAISTDHNFSARANLYNRIPFRASVGYNKTQGLVKNNDFERYSYSLKMTPKFLDDNLKVDFNAKGTITTKNSVDDGGAIGGAVAMDPTKPIYDSNSIFGGFYQNTRLNSGRNQLEGATNPLALLEQRTRPEKAIRFLGNIEFDYKMPFLKDLRAIVNLGLDASEARIREVYSDNAIATYRFNQGKDPLTNYVFNPGENYLENQTSTNQTMDAYLAYNKSLTGFVTKLDIQGGYTYQNFKIDGNKDIYQYNIDSGLREIRFDVNNPSNRYYNPLNLQAYFARANFDILDKYLFTATFRADGSSLFQKDQRWGYFPAVGAAWKIKDEAFIKDSEFFQNLKLRLGWGKTGQQNITGSVGYFPSSPFFEIGDPNSQYLPGYPTYSAKAFNPDVTWEKTDNYNIGLDFELFKSGLLSGAVDFYKRNTNDLLAVVPVPSGQGLTSTFIDNVGSIESKGFEANVDVKAVQTEDFSFTIGGNIAYNYSEVTSLKGITQVQASESGLPTGTGLFLANHAVGQQPYSAWVFQQIYDESGKPIPGAFRDLNGDNKIDNEDRYYKALRPNWTYGFTTNFNYKNWDLVANFRGQIGGQVYNSRLVTTGFTDRATQGTTSALNNVLNFYDGSADPLYQNFNGNDTFSDYLLEDATFLRLDNVTLGYKFNKFVRSSSLRVYGSVNNVFVLTKYSGQDPENFNAIDNNFYPRPRTYTFGVSLDF
ncbi:iron complex outermembrane recepter protein [Flavobacterium succinicans]|uniref:Iron complex outermembrane recepter protein n=1 Tax=Flavobacterium succinicans TaxID=29536 RepID=A0A1I4VVN2_9FLAO|nr:TonB-dependent receptor [Flavobacterium succinicans]SFN05262.1 iron complex outermembrane recepter protein [Flavobacterium succinicans]